jgi:hypothetical protein
MSDARIRGVRETVVAAVLVALASSASPLAAQPAHEMDPEIRARPLPRRTPPPPREEPPSPNAVPPPPPQLCAIRFVARPQEIDVASRVAWVAAGPDGLYERDAEGWRRVALSPEMRGVARVNVPALADTGGRLFALRAAERDQVAWIADSEPVLGPIEHLVGLTRQGDAVIAVFAVEGIRMWTPGGRSVNVAHPPRTGAIVAVDARPEMQEPVMLAADRTLFALQPGDATPRVTVDRRSSALIARFSRAETITALETSPAALFVGTSEGRVFRVADDITLAYDAESALGPVRLLRVRDRDLFWVAGASEARLWTGLDWDPVALPAAIPMDTAGESLLVREGDALRIRVRGGCERESLRGGTQPLPSRALAPRTQARRPPR